MITAVRTAPPTDSQIQTDVLNELAADITVGAPEVGVQVHQGIVTLTGTIDSYPKKLAAVDAAHRVRGVMDVVNRLVVKIPAAWERTDERVAAGVREALKADILVPDQRIRCTVADGTVTLEGRVDSWAERVHAEEAVQRQAGVRGVVNLLTVARAEVHADDIRRQILGALQRQADREAGRIQVAVSDGVVTLTGTVRSWAERNAIERAAQFVAGVRRVDDRTTLDPTR